jgi:tetratricopeptide (TPR) repeat protein
MIAYAVCGMESAGLQALGNDVAVRNTNRCFEKAMERVGIPRSMFETGPANSQSGDEAAGTGPAYGGRKGRSGDEYGAGLGGCNIPVVLHHPGRAIEACSKVIASSHVLGHEKALAYAYRGTVEVNQDNDDRSGRALADATSALALDENLAEAYFVEGEVRANTGYTSAAGCKDAIQAFDRAISIGLPRPMLVTAYFSRGMMHDGLKLHEHSRAEAQLAVDDFGRAIELDPNSPVYHRFRAYAEDDLGQKTAAEDDRAAFQRLGGKSQ